MQIANLRFAICIFPLFFLVPTERLGSGREKDREALSFHETTRGSHARRNLHANGGLRY
jgi:hypothetical protein